MEYLIKNQRKIALQYIKIASKVALYSTCRRSRCGSIIVKNGHVIGLGFNSPPKDNLEHKRCSYKKEQYHKKVTDKSCCIHAEQRAIINTLKNNPDKVKDSTLYFIRLDNHGKPKHALKPYCTICSKMALDVGIKKFVLWHKEGVCVYNTKQYNELSFSYTESHKLVRDEIPRIIIKNGVKPITHIANDAEYETALQEKLYEETKEFLDLPCIEEMADVLEVMHAICEYKGVDTKKLESVRQEKVNTRGGFKNRIILEDTKL